jgi:catechol 2,3-dioxygenase-like lactoylglutathione lyase family enzyme
MQTKIANTNANDRDTSLPSAILETCLDVTDLNRARDFYAGLFGYSVMRSDERFCAFSVGGHQILILFRRGSDPHGTVLPFGKIPPHGSNGQAHVGFRFGSMRSRRPPFG